MIGDEPSEFLVRARLFAAVCRSACSDSLRSVMSRTIAVNIHVLVKYDFAHRQFERE